LDVSGNFIEAIDGLDEQTDELRSLSAAFNEISRLPDVSRWSAVDSHEFITRLGSFRSRRHLSLLDLSYNLLTDLPAVVCSLKRSELLRVLFLHGNPLAVSHPPACTSSVVNHCPLTRDYSC
jgi:Leucine-rich repeat (LRR) protein